MAAGLLYKIMSAALWERAEAESRVPWAEIDRTDGFIHLSSAEQVRETARLHFAGQSDLVLLSLDPSEFAAASLRWEPSRGGALFPHIYADIPLAAVVAVAPLTESDAGFEFPLDVPNEVPPQ
jgi:uncharacterized protein (DUF952 family)